MAASTSVASSSAENEMDERLSAQPAHFFTTGKRKRGAKVKRRKRKSSFMEPDNTTPTLQKFGVSCASADAPVDDWVRTAVSRGVRELHVRVRARLGEEVRLPSQLFTSHALVDLHIDLGGSKLTLPTSLGLVGLRSMHLCSVSFYDDHPTHVLFSSCTALRSLALVNCNYKNLGRLEISSLCLRSLTIDSPLKADGLGSCKVNIAAPLLSSFEYRGVVAQAYDLYGLFSLVDVKVEFHGVNTRAEDEYHVLERVQWFLRRLFFVENLEICPACVQVTQIPSLVVHAFLQSSDSELRSCATGPLIDSVLVVDQALRRLASLPSYLEYFPFHCLDDLRMVVRRLDYAALGLILTFLVASPTLSSITVKVRGLRLLPSSTGKEHYVNILKGYSEHARGALRTVEIICIDSRSAYDRFQKFRCSHCPETVLELVKVLLGSQADLQKLLLSSCLFFYDIYPSPGEEEDFACSRRKAKMEKVLSFPTLSPKLVVAFI